MQQAERPLSISNAVPVVVPIVALAALLAAMWLASQGGFAPVLPGKFAATLMIVLESLPVLGALWLGAAGLGLTLRRYGPPRHHGLAVPLALGMAALLLGEWGLACLGWLNGATAWGLCGLGVALLGIEVWRLRGKPMPTLPPWPWSTVLLAPGLGLLLVAATCPPGTLWRVEAFGYDVLTYHLQLPREWLEAGAMRGLEHNVYSYLPNLVEAGYMGIGAMLGTMREGVYVCQLFHVSLAVLAGACLGRVVGLFAGRAEAVATAGMLVAVPWVLVTGSLAYDETAVLAFGAAGLAVALDAKVTWRHAAAVGFMAGAATLAKLPAGPMVAVPLGMILLLGLGERKPGGAETPDEARPEGRGTPQPEPVGSRWRRRAAMAGIAALAGLLTLSPYLVRNAIWTGNPVFPFASHVLGTAHWSAFEAERWSAGHGAEAATNGEGRLEALGRQWLGNVGYGAIGGRPAAQRPGEGGEVAHFASEGGVPVLWLAALAGGLLALGRRDTRRTAGALGLMLAVQVGFWLTATHLQSRFLMPTLLPAVALAGLGLGRLREMTPTRARWASPLILGATALLVGLLATASLGGLFEQVRPIPTADGQLVRVPPGQWADALNASPASGAAFDDHPINRLPLNSRTYLVADVGPLLYLRRPVVYHTAFDASPLGELIRQAQGDPGAGVTQVTHRLREQGITHVWIGWSELERLRGSYGYDPAVTPDMLRQLIASRWRRVWPAGPGAEAGAKPVAELYALPRR